MAVDRSKAIKKPAKPMTAAQKKKMVADLGKLRYDIPNEGPKSKKK